ncbi:MAG: 2,3-bisphosphoglycerate-independent phosphoglycerate mutase [Myxococcota bacterium]|nr:2,3-bisphosphoglycerate-independent phosphoglycerate mutase [Deltaproteobacteria bacterium]MDQ3337886.1 2,3-bisphosphoglycerate-independent phosphoglycerate mutase [Myxococcota bacterium]
MLRPHSKHAPKGPVLLVVMDGIGRGAGDEADAVTLAATPTMDRLWVPGMRAELRAHGKAVGLPSDDDMGNSEVGHNALGAGKIYAQGAKLVAAAIATGAMFEGAVWRQVVERGARGGAVHFLGLLSDGGVHSNIAHLEAMMTIAAKAGCRRLYVHALIDGRDVPPTSGLEYVDRIEQFLSGLRISGIDARIASGGGRMRVTMDRYEADWTMVELGWHAHVLADARQFGSAAQAIQTFRGEHPGIIDQDLPAFVCTPTVQIVDGDVVVMFNFRGDRAIEISRAFDDERFDKFDRVRRPDVLYAGMMEYDGDLKIPRHYLVTPPAIERPMGEILAASRVSQLAISETQKYGHVTYFWNGNRSGKFDNDSETYIEIPSDNVPFEQRPWMKAAEITDRLIAEMRSGLHRFARVNYANGDMVGHTGSFDATVIAVASVDLQLARLAKVVEELQGILVVTADHGNADEMYQRDKTGRVQRDKQTGQPVVKTSHSLNAVPFFIFDPARGDRYEIDAARAKDGGIANVTATCIELLGFVPPDDLEPSLLRFR